MGGFDLNSEGVSSIQSAAAPYQLLVSRFEWIVRRLCIVFIIPYMSKLSLYKNIYLVVSFAYGALAASYPLIALFYGSNEIVKYI